MTRNASHTTPLLVIVAGPPGTGKTTLARRLGRDLSLPYVGKDDIKERLFDSLGWSDRAWSKRLGVASIELLYYIIESQVSAGKSLVAESNFKRDWDGPRFLDLHKRWSFRSIEIQCWTEGQILYRRFWDRAQSGERHPGHVDFSTHEELDPVLLRGRHDLLDIGGEIIEVDTTDFSAVDYAAICDRVVALLQEPS